MLTNEDLQALSSLMDKKLEPINTRLDNMDQRLDNMDQRLNNMDQRLDNVEQRLDKIEERLEKIEEDGEITREVTNKIGEWVDFYFHDDKPYPLDEEEAEKYRESLRLAK